MTAILAQRAATALALMLVPAAAAAAPAAPAALTIKKPDITVVVTGRGSSAAQDQIQNVSLDGEVTGEDAQHDYGFRSIRLKLDIDCHRGRDRLRSVEMFPEAHLGGKPRTRPPPGGWAQPSSEAWLADVIRLLCGGPSTPSATSVSAPARAQAPAAPALPAPPPSAPAALRASAVVQVAAADTEAGARSAIARLRSMKGVSVEGLTPQIEAGALKGRPIYRAALSGFPGLAEARAFCVAVRAAGGKCFVR